MINCLQTDLSIIALTPDASALYQIFHILDIPGLTNEEAGLLDHPIATALLL